MWPSCWCAKAHWDRCSRVASVFWMGRSSLQCTCRINNVSSQALMASHAVQSHTAGQLPKMKSFVSCVMNRKCPCHSSISKNPKTRIDAGICMSKAAAPFIFCSESKPPCSPRQLLLLLLAAANCCLSRPASFPPTGPPTPCALPGERPCSSKGQAVLPQYANHHS